MGTVMTGGDSCGWVSSAHRGLPKNVIASMRVM